MIVGIVDDLDEEPTETLTVTLSNPSAGLTLVGELTATVTIRDNDQPVPGLTFEAGLIPTNSGWSSSGNKPWYAQTDTVYEGGYALRSGKITDAQESVLVLEQEAGAGTGYFMSWQVPSRIGMRLSFCSTVACWANGPAG